MSIINSDQARGGDAMGYQFGDLTRGAAAPGQLASWVFAMVNQRCGSQIPQEIIKHVYTYVGLMRRRFCGILNFWALISF